MYRFNAPIDVVSSCLLIEGEGTYHSMIATPPRVLALEDYAKIAAALVTNKNINYLYEIQKLQVGIALNRSSKSINTNK